MIVERTTIASLAGGLSAHATGDDFIQGAFYSATAHLMNKELSRKDRGLLGEAARRERNIITNQNEEDFLTHTGYKGFDSYLARILIDKKLEQIVAGNYARHIIDNSPKVIIPTSANGWWPLKYVYNIWNLMSPMRQQVQFKFRYTWEDNNPIIVPERIYPE